MTDLLTCVRGKLDDPILMDWALRHYEKTQSRDPVLARQMEQAWFDNRLHKLLVIKGRPLLHQNFIGDRSKVGRNDPCPCGSGQKFKRCCLNTAS